MVGRQEWQRTRHIRMINQASLDLSDETCILVWSTHTKEPLGSHGIRQNEWQHKVAWKLAQLDSEHKAFRRGGCTPEDYTKINVHLYDYKRQGDQARLVAGGHMTNTPIDSVYSGVVSQRPTVVTFLAEPKQLELWATDVGNAFLESHSEHVLFKAGPEFGTVRGRSSSYALVQFTAEVEHVGTTRCGMYSDLWILNPRWLRRTFS
jgi:hypothetical protein